MGVMRMRIQTILAVTLLSGLALTMSVHAQAPAQSSSSSQTRSPTLQEFLPLAHSSATLQARAAQLAAERQTRPEVRDFAQGALEFRTGQVQRLEAFAKEHGLAVPAVKAFEHQVLLENLEPLDYLALSRRYAEFQVDALEQELRIYQAAGRGTDEALRSFAGSLLPQLEQQFADARKLREAVGP
jgi:predicted outer membrane protein